MILRQKDGKFTSKNRILIKIGIGLFLIAGLFAMVSNLAENLTNWGATHSLTIQKPLVLQTRPIVVIGERKPVEVLSPIAITVVESTNDEDLTDTEKIILRVFGERNFQVARAVAKEESGLREDAFHANTNGTIDIGIFQINSAHFSKEGCSLKELVVAESNIECAYSLWEDQGWNPWVVWQTGAFKGSL